MKMEDSLVGKISNILSDIDGGDFPDTWEILVRRNECTTCVELVIDETFIETYDDGSTCLNGEYIGDSDFIYKFAKRVALEVLTK